MEKKNFSSKGCFVMTAVFMASSIISLLCSNIPLSILWICGAVFELIIGFAVLKKEKKEKEEEQK